MVAHKIASHQNSTSASFAVTSYISFTCMDEALYVILILVIVMVIVTVIVIVIVIVNRNIVIWQHAKNSTS